MIDERKKQLMKRVVDAYISTARPVGSAVLVQRYRLSWSSATIRNELSFLEDAGYMFQPYTSAGRVPTQMAYRRYFEDLKSPRLNRSIEQSLRRMAGTISSHEDLRELCRILSHFAEEIVFCVGPSGTFSAGIRFLTEKPECDDQSFMRDVTTRLDACDEIVERICDDIDDDAVYATIGDSDTFGASCSALIIRVGVDAQQVHIGILGPLRMNYQKNIALLNSLI